MSGSYQDGAPPRGGLYRVVEAGVLGDPFTGLDYEPVTLAGPNEIADALDVERNTIWVWQRRHADFPQPVVQLTIGSVWVLEDVTAWHEARVQA